MFNKCGQWEGERGGKRDEWEGPDSADFCDYSEKPWVPSSLAHTGSLVKDRKEEKNMMAQTGNLSISTSKPLTDLSDD